MGTPIRRLLVMCLAALPSTLGWEAGFEYVYEYDAQLALGLDDTHELQSAVVRFHSQLTVQSVDDNTLAVKLSEIRMRRHGSASTISASGDHVWLPIETPDGQDGHDEAVGDALHLLSPFVVSHNKGSFVALTVERDEPDWSVNVKKAAASIVQLDVTGVRSAPDGGVFGERSSSINSLEDAVTGDCLTNLRFTRLPYHRAVRQLATDEGDRVAVELCRSSNIYEIVKTKDFDDCRVDPLHSSSTSGGQWHQLKRSAAYKYLACGDSSERATIVQVDGAALVASSGVALRQSVRLALKGRAPIRQLLANVTLPKVHETLVYSTPDARIDALIAPTDALAAILTDAAERLEALKSDADVVERLSVATSMLARFDAAQLTAFWQASINSSARDLFLDCAAASGTHPSANFLLDLVELGKVSDIQAAALLASIGHSIQLPDINILQRFVRIAKMHWTSRSLKATALAVAAELLHSHCVVAQSKCHPESQVVTEDFLPFAVSQLENAATSGDRLAVISALGALGVDDVLLLLVPYIRGDDVTARIAAIRSLRRLLDSSPDKVVPLLSSLADNVAERAEVRMAAIDLLLFHPDTPLKIWRKIAHRTWFEPVQQVNSYVYSVVRSLASSQSNSLSSSSANARQVLPMMRPSPDRGAFHLKSFDDFFFKMTSWRVGNGPLPAFADLQLFYRLGNAPFDAVQLSVWNYNTESFWSELFGPAPAQPRSAKLLSEIWDQISLRYRPEDDRTGLAHLRLVGSTLEAFVHFDDARRRPAGDVRLVKFQPLADFRTSAPTELGLPARFKSTLAGVVSARGSVAGVASLASLKLSCEARVTLPFSAHYASAGVDLRVELRAPRHVTVAESLAWKPPDQDTDFAYFHVVPFTLTRSLADETVPPTEAQELRVVSSRGASRFTQHLGANFRFEVTSVAAPDASASVWLRRLIDADLSALSPRRLDHRVFRLRYLPDAPLDSVAVSASIETLRRDAGVDFISRLNDTAPIDAAAQLHRVTSRITTRYSNGTTNQWTPFEFEIERADGPDEYVNVIASPISDFIRPWFNSVDPLLSKRLANKFLQSAISNVTGGPSSVQLEQYGPVGALLRGSTSKTCLVRLDAVTTYDGIEYDYNLNECHHILTADCSKSGARYAITGRSDPVHGVAVRVTLANDVIDLSSANVSINGVLLESNATRVRLRSGDNVMATLTRSDDEIHFRLLHEQIHVVLNESGVVIHAGDQLLGVACGLCGDGDGETGGEFKTADRCALSSGSLMAASFQISHERDECPLLSDDAFQRLQKESYPCYSIDEQVPSILPLPPES